METPLILERLYRLAPRKRPRRPLLKAFKRRLVRWVQGHTSRLVVGSLVVGGFIAFHVYYYNKLIRLQYDVKTARAQIEVEEEKRSHVRRDLTDLVQYYASYEQRVLDNVTTIRAKHPPAAAVASPQQLLARLNAVAEQYPNLNLEKSVHQFSEISTQIENEIAVRAVKYNTAVNLYTTVLHSFPGDFFGSLLGFRDIPYYRPAQSDLAYRVVKP